MKKLWNYCGDFWVSGLIRCSQIRSKGHYFFIFGYDAKLLMKKLKFYRIFFRIIPNRRTFLVSSTGISGAFG